MYLGHIELTIVETKKNLNELICIPDYLENCWTYSGFLTINTIFVIHNKITKIFISIN